MPQTVRQMGPWQGSREGALDALAPRYRALIEEQGFVVVLASVVLFKPEDEK